MLSEAVQFFISKGHLRGKSSQRKWEEKKQERWGKQGKHSHFVSLWEWPVWITLARLLLRTRGTSKTVAVEKRPMHALPTNVGNLRKHLKRHIGEKFKGNSQFAGFWEGPVKNTCEAVVQNWEHEENVV